MGIDDQGKSWRRGVSKGGQSKIVVMTPREDCVIFFFFKQKTAYEIGTGDWSSDVCSSDLVPYLEMGGSIGFLFGN